MINALFQLCGNKLFGGILIAVSLGWFGFVPTIIGSVAVIGIAIYLWLKTKDEREGFGTLIVLVWLIALLLVICVMWLSYLFFSGNLHHILMWIAERLPK